MYRFIPPFGLSGTVRFKCSYLRARLCTVLGVVYAIVWPSSKLLPYAIAQSTTLLKITP